MIKVFTHNKNGNIELTAKELENLLDEAYREGYNANIYHVYSYPNYYEHGNISSTPFACTYSNGATAISLKGGDANDGE